MPKPFVNDIQIRDAAKVAHVLQVKGVLDKEEVLFAKNKGYLYGTHVVVGLPQCLAEASKEPHAVAVMQHTLAVAVDEVDACFLVIPGPLLFVATMFTFLAMLVLSWWVHAFSLVVVAAAD